MFFKKKDLKKKWLLRRMRFSQQFFGMINKNFFGSFSWENDVTHLNFFILIANQGKVIPWRRSERTLFFEILKEFNFFFFFFRDHSGNKINSSCLHRRIFILVLSMNGFPLFPIFSHFSHFLIFNVTNYDINLGIEWRNGEEKKVIYIQECK